MSTRSRTHHRPHDHEPSPPRRSGDLNPSTLVIAAAASAVAAYVTSKVWAAGALWSAAMSPIIVALVKEGLNRPADAIRTVRVTRGGRSTEIDLPATAADELARRAPGGTGPVTVYGSRTAGRRRWRLAVVTGLLAFAVVAVVYTVPELVAGKSIGGGSEQRTTLFGGNASKKSAADDTKDTKDKGAEKTPTPEPGATATPTPTATATPGASVTPTPTPSVAATPTPPAATAPVPSTQATPAPTP